MGQSRAAANKKSATKRTKAKVKQYVNKGHVHILATFNNTIINITDVQGNTLAWATSRTAGFSGARKSTPYAAMMAADIAARKVQDDYQMKDVDVFVQGPGPGRESAIRALQAAGLSVHMIIDTTPIPHNGCRPAKRRRV